MTPPAIAPTLGLLAVVPLLIPVDELTGLAIQVTVAQASHVWIMVLHIWSAAQLHAGTSVPHPCTHRRKSEWYCAVNQ